MIITLGDIVKRIMDVRYMNNADLGRASGLSRNTIRMVKKDKTSYKDGLRLSTVFAVAKALKVPRRLLMNAPYEIENEEKGEIIDE